MNTKDKLGLSDNPVITGLWQVADLERDGATLEHEQAVSQLVDYMTDGFTCIDMADHYGSAELIAGAARAQIEAQHPLLLPETRLYTKWCPEPHQCTYDAVRDGVMERLDRLQVDCLDLLQLHWWSFDHPGYIDVMDHLSALKHEGLIRHIGVTNFDTDHLEVLLSCGFEIVSNQVCLSVLDQRALGDMSELCQSSGVRLLAYGSLAGGFISERWLDQTEPEQITDWSKMKYQRFIQAAGGWQVFQTLLQTLKKIGDRHSASISNVATRWVLQQASVAGVIVGARLTERQYRDSNRQMLSFTLTETDLNEIAAVTDTLSRITGDCGTEYRRPPFLTASGDLSHHINSLPPVYQKEAIAGRTETWRLSSGSEYESICGYSRGMRTGNRIVISGTTATHGTDRVIGEDNIRAQTVYILDKISASLASLGGSMEDVIRTRIYLTDQQQWETVSRVHGRYFDRTLPANTLVEISGLVGPYTVEIEAEAVI